MSARWHLLMTKPRGETDAARNLRDQHYEVYLPLLSVKKRLRGRYQYVTEAMFPRYLFVRLSEGIDDWGPIRSTPGVSGLVRFGKEHAIAPDELIEALQNREDENGLIPFKPPKLGEGDKVRITEGAFKDVEAIIHSSSGDERVILLMTIAGTEAKVTASIHNLVPAD